MSAEATTAPAQHLRALARANEVRLARAELKRRIGAGDVSIADVILDAPWEAKTMTVADLLLSQQRWGYTRCRRFLQCVPLTESKTVGTLTDRQRGAVAEMLEASTWARPARRELLEPAYA